MSGDAPKAGDRREAECAYPNVMLSKLLTVCAGASLGLIGLGLALSLLRPPPADSVTTPFANLAGAAARCDPVALVSLGLVVLLATPAVRVVALWAAYARRREWLLCAIAASVLLVLIASFVIGVQG